MTPREIATLAALFGALGLVFLLSLAFGSTATPLRGVLGGFGGAALRLRLEPLTTKAVNELAAPTTMDAAELEWMEAQEAYEALRAGA